MRVQNVQVQFMRTACRLCDNSKCGYKTGCIAVKGNKILVGGWNETLSGEIYCQDGTCVREIGHLKGKELEKVCSIHAEASVVAQAASREVSLKDCDIYVTTFPCIICSRLLAKTGVKNLFYMSDYLTGNIGLPILRGANIGVNRIPENEVWSNGEIEVERDLK